MGHIELAIGIATIAHGDQKDKCGEPYIFHPLRVMMTVQGSLYRQVAVLHDVIEDTETTLEDLEVHFSPDVTDALKAITHASHEPYIDYLNRVMANPIAKVVKIADIKDNASPSRLYKLDPPTIERLTKKYSMALKYLGDV